ncbi:MAG TPA: YqgE/AlgH family protein [Opitutus sp.]|jgi:putative transcriptional regulator|nr:YqgE/AlgH family protein [Opitutus sp.]
MRERRQAKKESLAGSLLLAHPALKDPNFRRTVILMSAHSPEGAMGVVLNRPTGKHLGELNGDFALGTLASVPIFSGGPVQTEQLLLVAWQPHEEGFRLHFGVEPDRATQLATEEGTQLRAFLGYSGWSGGQLENELKASTWIVTDVPAELLDHAPGKDLWRRVLGALGEEWRLLAEEPEDTSLN